MISVSLSWLTDTFLSLTDTNCSSVWGPLCFVYFALPGATQGLNITNLDVVALVPIPSHDP